MEVITAKNLHVPRPSPDWMRKLAASLVSFAGPHDPLLDAIYGKDWPGRNAVQSIYSVGLTSIIEAKSLDHIGKPFCWRFVAGGHKGVTKAAGCWATHESHDSPAKIMATFRGPEMADLLLSAEMLNELNELLSRPQMRFELRVLRIPALYFEAFWLKCPQGDWVVPYGLLYDGKGLVKLGMTRLDRNKAYPVADFLKIVKEAAKQRVAAHQALL